MPYYVTTITGARASITLDEKVGGGAAGDVFRSPDLPGSLVKIYREPLVPRAKLEAMLATPPALPPLLDKGSRYPQIAWPEAIVESASGEMSGFIMPEIAIRGSVPLTDMLQKKSRHYARLPEAYKVRVVIAKNLASLFVKIHECGHSMIDIKPENIRVYRTTMFLAVLDCDGFLIKGPEDEYYPSQHISNDYIAPESFAKLPSECGRNHDLFALAVLFFQLLNNGIHPFQGVPKDPAKSLGTIDERVKQNIYCYGSRGHSLQLPSPQSIHSHLEDETLQLFERAFTSLERPTAEEWNDHLGRVLTKFRFCRSSREHGHFSKRCGFCQLEKRTQKLAKRKIAASHLARLKPPFPLLTLPKKRGRIRRVSRTLVAGILVLLVLRMGVHVISHRSKTEETSIADSRRSNDSPQVLLSRGKLIYKEKRFNEAREVYEKAATLGLGQAQYNLALMYLEGKGGPRDLRGGRDLLRRAAGQGLALAQNKLGDLYWEEGNFIKAKEWYSRAAAQEDPFALNSLGVMYDEGLGVLQDAPRARELFNRASDKGLYQAQFNLAEMYYKGRGGEQNLRKARELYLKAAAQGHLEAQNMAGLMYYLGEGGEPELKLAKTWWEKAAAQGHDDARANLQRHFS